MKKDFDSYKIKLLFSRIKKKEIIRIISHIPMCSKIKNYIAVHPPSIQIN